MCPFPLSHHLLNAVCGNVVCVSTHVCRNDCIQSTTRRNEAILKYFLVLLYYILFLELLHCEMKLKGRHFHFSINTDGNLGVSLQTCENLNFIDLYEKEELWSIFLTLHKRGIGKILVRVLQSKSTGKNLISATIKEETQSISVPWDFMKVYCDNIDIYVII